MEFKLRMGYALMQGYTPFSGVGIQSLLRVRLLFAYTDSAMAFGFPVPSRKVFVVSCKGCRREVSAGVEAFPYQSIVVACPLRGELEHLLK